MWTKAVQGRYPSGLESSENGKEKSLHTWSSRLSWCYKSLFLRAPCLVIGEDNLLVPSLLSQAMLFPCSSCREVPVSKCSEHCCGWLQWSLSPLWAPEKWNCCPSLDSVGSKATVCEWWLGLESRKEGMASHEVLGHFCIKNEQGTF